MSVYGKYLCFCTLPRRSQIDTDDTGRVDKATVLHALQASGESYDRARETLKHVSVDASGKVELEDWVEVRTVHNDVTMSETETFLSSSSTRNYDPRDRRLC